MKMNKFKYSVVGNNTEDNRKWLESIGYVNYHDNVHGEVLCVPIQYRSDVLFYETITSELLDLIIKDYFVDCIGNDKLFRAVSALRDENDYMQWFTDGTNWGICPVLKMVDDIWVERFGLTPHKATLDELIMDQYKL